jgi:hypothetical protein
MTVTPEQFVNGVIAFADVEMIPLMRNQSHQLVSGIAIVLMQKRAINSLDKFTKHPAVEALGIVDEDGFIDIDILFEAVTASMEKYADGKFDLDPRTLLGSMSGLLGQSYTSFTFKTTDIENLHAYIKAQAQPHDEEE